MMPETAIILAAGLGTRMRPLTDLMPKPLIPVVNKPLIDWCLDWVAAGGIKHTVVNTSYRAAQLEDYLKPRIHPAVRISREDPVPLETGGGIVNALPLLGHDPFLAMNSDAIFLQQSHHPIARLAAQWDDTLDFLMLLVPRNNAVGWQGSGDFIRREDGAIRRPHVGEEAEYIFSGVEIIHPRVFEGAPHGAFSLSRLWDARRMAGEGWYQHIRAVVHDGAWLNVGDLAGLVAAEEYLKARDL